MAEPTSTEVRFPGHDGWELGGVLAVPAGEGPFPAVVVVHEIFGVTDHLRDIARRLAAAGFIALVPDLWSRSPDGKVDAPEGASDLRPLAEEDLVILREFVEVVPDAQMVGDLVGAVRYLEERPDVRERGIGTIGFCMGGIYAFHLACERPAVVRACVDFYGRLVYPHPTKDKPRGNLERVKELACPLLGIFGALDPLIPLEQVLELKNKVGGKGSIIAYPRAGHAFHNDTRPSYRPDDAADAWRRTLLFLRTHLAPDTLPAEAGPAVPAFPKGQGSRPGGRRDRPGGKGGAGGKGGGKKGAPWTGGGGKGPGGGGFKGGGGGGPGGGFRGHRPSGGRPPGGGRPGGSGMRGGGGGGGRGR